MNSHELESLLGRKESELRSKHSLLKNYVDNQCDDLHRKIDRLNPQQGCNLRSRLEQFEASGWSWCNNLDRDIRELNNFSSRTSSLAEQEERMVTQEDRNAVKSEAENIKIAIDSCYKSAVASYSSRYNHANREYNSINSDVPLEYRKSPDNREYNSITGGTSSEFSGPFVEQHNNRHCGPGQ